MAVALNQSLCGEGNGMDPCDKHRGDGGGLDFTQIPRELRARCRPTPLPFLWFRRAIDSLDQLFFRLQSQESIPRSIHMLNMPKDNGMGPHSRHLRSKCLSPTGTRPRMTK